MEAFLKRYMVTLTYEERQELKSITQKGKHRSQKVLNALILLNSDEGRYQDSQSKNKDISGILQISMRKIDRVKKCFVEQGLECFKWHKRSKSLREKS